jgi:hypothetical protein
LSGLIYGTYDDNLLGPGLSGLPRQEENRLIRIELLIRAIGPLIQNLAFKLRPMIHRDGPGQATHIRQAA